MMIKHMRGRLLVAAFALAALGSSLETHGAEGRAELARSVRRTEFDQNDISGLAARTAEDLRAVRDEYIYNRLLQEPQAAKLDDVADALSRMADPDHAERIINMPWVVTKLASARQAATILDARRGLMEAAQGQGDIVAELERLLRTHARQMMSSGPSSLSNMLEAQEKLQRETQDLGDRTLGRALDELDADEANSLADLAERQKDLQRELDAAKRELREAARDLHPFDPLQANALEETAARLERADVDRNMEAAARDIDDNQLLAAQDRQQDVIDALRDAEQSLAAMQPSPLVALEHTMAELDEMISRQDALAAETDGLDQNSPRQDWNDLQIDQATLEYRARQLAGMEDSESLQMARQAMNEAQQALSQAQRDPARQSMERSLEELRNAQADAAQRLAELQGQDQQQQQQQLAGPQQPSQPDAPDAIGMPDPGAEPPLFGRRWDAPGRTGWLVSLEPGEREVLATASAERMPGRYERDIIMYYRNLAAAGDEGATE